MHDVRNNSRGLPTVVAKSVKQSVNHYEKCSCDWIIFVVWHKQSKQPWFFFISALFLLGWCPHLLPHSSSFSCPSAITPTPWCWPHLRIALSNTFSANMTADEVALFISSLLSQHPSEQNIVVSDQLCRAGERLQHILIPAPWVTAQQLKQPGTLV